MMTSKTYETELCSSAASVASCSTDNSGSNSTQGNYIDNLVDTIWGKAKMSGRIQARNSVPLLWFKNYIKTSLPAIGNDATKYENFINLINKGGKDGHIKRVSKERAKAFFAALQLRSDKDQDLEESLQILEDSDDAPNSDEASGYSSSSITDANEAQKEGVEQRLSGNFPSGNPVKSLYQECLESGDFQTLTSTPMCPKRELPPTSLVDSESETPTNLSKQTIASSEQHHRSRIMTPTEEINEQLESEISSMSSQISAYRKEGAGYCVKIDSLKQGLDDEREKNERLIEKFQQLEFDHRKREQFLEGHAESMEQERDRLRLQLLAKDEAFEVERTGIKEQVVDYEIQISDLTERQAILCHQNEELADRISELRVQKMNMDAILEESSQEGMSPDKVLAKAVKECKNSNSAVSRLNKSENDLSWWRDQTSPKPLKTVRKPADFNGQPSGGGGENLSAFIPKHAPSTQTQSSQTPLSLHQKRPHLAKSLTVSASLNLVLLATLVYLALYQFRELFMQLGVLKITHHPDFSRYF